MGAAWERHAMCESALTVRLCHSLHTFIKTCKNHFHLSRLTNNFHDQLCTAPPAEETGNLRLRWSTYILPLGLYHSNIILKPRGYHMNHNVQR